MSTDPDGTDTSDAKGMDQRFLAEHRLCTLSQFRHVYDKGRRAGDGHLLIVGVLNGLNRTRIGLSVSRKHGPAVVRNRKKRRMREAFRTIRSQLRVGLDLVLIPRHRDDFTVNDFRESLIQLTARLNRQLTRSSNSRTTKHTRPPKER
jgi:ribonuclease P protein component